MIHIKNYLSLIKFSHTIFAMPFALIGFSLGIKQAAPIAFSAALEKFIFVVCCMVFARSAAMSFNRYLDRKIDALNPRTSSREIPAGVIRSNSALWFTIVTGLLFILFSFAINEICFYLSPVALFVILFYSYTKRFTSLCHLVLGVGLSLAPIGAYLAVTGFFAWVPLLFSFAVIGWVSGFDIIYSLQDEEFDRSQRLHSIPVALGKTTALRLSAWIHFFSAFCIFLAGWLYNAGWLYYCGTVFFISMLFYQHTIVKPNDLSRVNIAFMTANGVASVLFAVFVLLDLFILH